jgi:hypothetical protein
MRTKVWYWRRCRERVLVGLSLAVLCLWAGSPSISTAADPAPEPIAGVEEPPNASESVTMKAYGFSSNALAVGTKGNGGTSFEAQNVTLTYGNVTGAGSIAIQVSCNWTKRGQLWGDATLKDPSLWVAPQANGIDVEITLTNITAVYYNWWADPAHGGYTDTGPCPNMTLTMKGGNVGGPVTRVWTSAPQQVTLSFGMGGVSYTLTGTRTVTIRAH